MFVLFIHLPSVPVIAFAAPHATISSEDEVVDVPARPHKAAAAARDGGPQCHLCDGAFDNRDYLKMFKRLHFHDVCMAAVRC